MINNFLEFLTNWNSIVLINVLEIYNLLLFMSKKYIENLNDLSLKNNNKKLKISLFSNKRSIKISIKITQITFSIHQKIITKNNKWNNKIKVWFENLMISWGRESIYPRDMITREKIINDGEERERRLEIFEIFDKILRKNQYFVIIHIANA